MADETRQRLVNALSSPTLAEFLQNREPRQNALAPYANTIPSPHDVLSALAGPIHDWARDDAEMLRHGVEPRPRSLFDIMGALPIGPFGAVGGPRPQYTLSQNTPWRLLDPDIPDGIPGFNYSILQEGQPVGAVRGYVHPNTPDTAYIGFIENAPGQGRLSREALQQMQEAFRRDFPDVTTFYGNRTSGARLGTHRVRMRDREPQY